MRCHCRLVTKKTTVSRCICQDWDTLNTNQECHADLISQVKGSCRGSEVHYSMAGTSIPALLVKKRVTPWAEDENIQALRQELDAHRALRAN